MMKRSTILGVVLGVIALAGGSAAWIWHSVRIDPVALVKKSPSICKGLTNEQMFNGAWGEADWSWGEGTNPKPGILGVVAKGREQAGPNGGMTVVYSLIQDQESGEWKADLVSVYNGSDEDIAEVRGSVLGMVNWLIDDICPIARKGRRSSGGAG